MKRFAADFKLLTDHEKPMWRNRKLWAALGVVALVPLVYCLIFLSSLIDPYGHLDRLPAGLVNLDSGAAAPDGTVNLGRQLADSLETRRAMDFRIYGDAAAARQAVHAGEIYFALVIPADFSTRALAAAGGTPGRLELYTSPGNNQFATRVAQSLTGQAATELNRQLAEKRWEKVGALLPQAAAGLDSIGQAVKALDTGAAKLADGSRDLDRGAAALAEGLEQAATGAVALAGAQAKVAGGTAGLTSGMEKLADGIRGLGAAVPARSDLAALENGAVAVAGGSRQLADGLYKLADGSAVLAESSGRNPLAPAALKTGTRALADGQAQAAQAARDLADGNDKLAGGVQSLSQGTGKIKDALDAMGASLPAQDDLDALSDGSVTLAAKGAELASGLDNLAGGAAELAAGSAALNQGASQLHEGLSALAAKLPTSFGSLPGDPAGLAASVVVHEESCTGIVNNAESFAPYFMAVSLWIGVLISTFIFPYLLLADAGRDTRQSARIASKLVAPAVLTAVQALAVCLGVMLLGIRYQHFFLTLATAVLSSWCYLAVVFALLVWLGDAGRLMAVLLLVLQISAAGGSFPIELSPPFFVALHPFLPVSSTVTALRAGVSGAAPALLPAMLLRLLAITALALVMALPGRFKWRFVAQAELRPAISL